jgi:hypothetical protein
MNGNGSGYRGRTLKRRSGAAAGGSSDEANAAQSSPANPENVEKQNNFLSFLNAQADNAYRRPWHRLEHGLRLNRLRLFVEEEAQRTSYSAEEKERLYNLLVKALDRKLLNSKNNVLYDVEGQRITEVKGLVMHRGADGAAVFKILDKKAGGMTVRRRAADKIEVTGSAVAAADDSA